MTSLQSRLRPSNGSKHQKGTTRPFTPTYELHGTECVHGSAGQTRPGDVVIAISNSGETGELKATVTCLKNVGVHIIALTGNPNSWLANEAEVALIAGVEHEGDSMTSCSV